MAFAVSTAPAWLLLSVDHGPAHLVCLNSPANTYYQTRPVITMTASLLTTHWGRVPLVHGIYYPASAWLIQLRAYAMPSVPVPPITLTLGYLGMYGMVWGTYACPQSVCLVTLSLSEARRRLGGQVSTIPYQSIARELITKPRPLAVIRNRRLNSVALLALLRSVQFSSVHTLATATSRMVSTNARSVRTPLPATCLMERMTSASSAASCFAARAKSNSVRLEGWKAGHKLYKSMIWYGAM